MARREPTKPGLPAERTLLSWERTAFGFLVGGALVMLRQHGPLGAGRTVLALMATLLALLVLVIGYRRAQQIRVSPVVAGRVVMSAAHGAVLLIGGATVAFATAIVAALLYSAALG